MASVALDETADAVVGHAATFAAAFGLPLVLLHVVSPIHGAPRAADAVRAAERLHEANAHARLAALAGPLRSTMTVEVEVRCGDTAEEIAEAAASRRTLVTIASGGSAAHHRPGSIAYRVLCLSDSPVLAIPLTPHAGA